MIERLAVLHHAKVVIGYYFKDFKNFIKHLPVLGRYAYFDGKIFARPAQKVYQRGHFYGLRPGAENRQDFFSCVFHPKPFP